MSWRLACTTPAKNFGKIHAIGKALVLDSRAAPSAARKEGTHDMFAVRLHETQCVQRVDRLITPRRNSNILTECWIPVSSDVSLEALQNMTRTGNCAQRIRHGDGTIQRKQRLVETQSMKSLFAFFEMPNLLVRPRDGATLESEQHQTRNGRTL